MQSKKTLIICQSVHHGNTLKIAEVIAGKLNAEIKKPSEVNIDSLDEYDLIGFGSGIYNGKHHVNLFKLIDKFKPQNNKKAFIFSTATICVKKLNEPLRTELVSKEFEILDEFICKGFINYSFTKYIFGGINKKRPNERDKERARDFTLKLKGRY